MISNEKIKNKILKMAFSGDLVGIKEKVESYKGYYAIPNNWEWKKLGDIVNIVNGFTPLRTEKSFWDKPEISWFTIDDMRKQGHFINKTEQYITNKALGNSTNRLLPPNTTLLCCTASVGEVAYTNIPLTTNQQFNGLIVKDDYKDTINSLYIFEYAKTLKEILIDKAGKTTINFVSTKKLSEIMIPIPPLEVQNTIVDKLENVFTLMDKKEKNDQELDTLKRVLTKKVLSMSLKGILTNSENFETKTFEEVFDIVNGFTPLRTNKEYWENGTIPWFTVDDIKKQGHVINETIQHITKKAIGNKKIVPKDSVILCCTSATIGNYAYTNIDLTTNQQWNALIVNDSYKQKLLSKFVFYFVQTLKEKMLIDGNSTTFPFIPVKKIGKYEISFPNITEQKKIVEKIESLFELIEQL